MTLIEQISLAIIGWGLLGAICILSIGLYKDIENYIEIKGKQDEEI